MHLWEVHRPARIEVADKCLANKNDLTLLGLSAVTGGPLECERRISRAWAAFDAQRARLTSKSPSMGARWERWLRHVSPVLALGSWGWLWDATAKSRVDATMNRMVLSMLGHGKPEDEAPLRWHDRTLREANGWISMKLGNTFAEWILGQCASTWGCWLCRHRLILTRRMMSWQRALHYTREAELAMACRMRSGWRRRRTVGRRQWSWRGRGGWRSCRQRPLQPLWDAM